MKTTTWKAELPLWLLLTAMFVLAAATWNTAPDRIPIHWNLSGEADRYAGRLAGLFLPPLVALGLYVAMLFLPRVDPWRANYERFAGAYAAIRVSVLVVPALLYGLQHATMAGLPVDRQTVLPLVLCGLLLVLGNVMGKLRPNWFIGIRTPWTLSSKTAWVRTHRIGGWVLTLLGLAGIVISALGVRSAQQILLGGLLASAAALTVYSYIVWRDADDKLPPVGTMSVRE